MSSSGTTPPPGFFGTGTTPPGTFGTGTTPPGTFGTGTTPPGTFGTGTTPPGTITTPLNTMAPVDWSNYTPNPGAIDTAGLMAVLSKYLVNSPLIHNNDGDFNHVDDQIDTINAQLSSISNSLSGNNTSANILSQQDNVKTILETEMDRLNHKQQGVESAMSTQKRMLMMNDSYIKRQKVYTQIMVVISIGLVVLIICRVLSGYFEDDENSNVLLSMISILVIVFVIIYCVWTFVLMWRRDPIYFDQLKYIPDDIPAKLLNENSLGVGQEISSSVSSNFLNDKYCIGSSCCSMSNGTVWDETTNSCKKQEGFTQTNLQPFDADEYANYQKVPQKKI